MQHVDGLSPIVVLSIHVSPYTHERSGDSCPVQQREDVNWPMTTGPELPFLSVLDASNLLSSWYRHVSHALLYTFEDFLHG